MPRELNIVVDLSHWRLPRLSSRSWAVIAGAALFLALSQEAGSQLEDVKLNTYFPAPSGVYQQLMTSGNAYFATSGGAAEIGSPGGSGTPSANVANAALVVASGNVGIGTAASGVNSPSYYFNQPGGGGGLRIGPYVSGGQAQIQLDNSQSNQAGQLNRWQNRLEIWASDQIGLGTGPGYNDPLNFFPGKYVTIFGFRIPIQPPMMIFQGSTTVSQLINMQGVNYIDPGVPALGNVPYGCSIHSSGCGSNPCQISCPSNPNNVQHASYSAIAVSGGGGCPAGTVAVFNGPVNSVSYTYPSEGSYGSGQLQWPTGWTYACSGSFGVSGIYVTCCDL